jgi:hypothetical protein
MAKTVLDLLDSLPPADRRWIRSRTTAALRRAFNEGIGQFLLSALCLTLAMIATRGWYIESRNYNDAIHQRVQDTIGARHESRREDQYTGLLSILLTPINRAPDAPAWQCPDTDKSCAAQSSARQTFIQLAQLALSSRPIDEDEFITVISPTFSIDPNTLHGRAWLQSTYKTLKAVQPQTSAEPGVAVSPIELTPCVTPDASAREMGLGQAYCQRPAADRPTTLVVPAPLQLLPATPDAPPQFSSRVRRAVALSSFLDDVMQFPSAATANPSSALVQAYFVSADGILRIWSKRGAIAEAEFPPTTIWSSANYFRVFYKKEPPQHYSTPAYLDFGGHGVIRTDCDPVDYRSDDGKQTELVGIICTDYRLDETALFRAIVSSPFFKPLVVVMAPQSGKGLQAMSFFQLTAQGALTEIRDRSFAVRNDVTLAAIQAAVETTSLGNDSASLGRQVTEVPLATSRAFLLPLYRTGAEFRGLLVVPQPPVPPGRLTALLILSVTLATVAVALWLAGALLTRGGRELQRKLTLLRNLQVGVTVVDENDNIVEANDRAEELLATLLPKVGSARPPVPTTDVIKNRIVEGRPGNFTPRDYKTIEQLRAHGQASSYYARVRTSEKWVKVSATPMVFVGDRVQHRAGAQNVLASIEPVDEGVAAELETQLPKREIAAASAPGGRQKDA